VQEAVVVVQMQLLEPEETQEAQMVLLGAMEIHPLLLHHKVTTAVLEVKDHLHLLTQPVMAAQELQTQFLAPQ